MYLSSVTGGRCQWLLLLISLVTGDVHLESIGEGKLDAVHGAADTGIMVEQEHILAMLAQLPQASPQLSSATLENMEATLTAMARSQATPAMNNFMTQVLHITENNMKVEIMTQINASSARMNKSRETVEKCYVDMLASLDEAKRIRNTLPALKNAWMSCLGKLLLRPDDDADDPGLIGINPDVVKAFVASGAPGADTCPLTAITCERAECACKQWAPYNSIPGFDMRPDPDSTVCDRHDGHEDVGDFLHSTYEYWASMVEEFIGHKQLCDQWALWCDGNQSECPIEPAPGPFPPCGFDQCGIDDSYCHAPSPSPLPAPWPSPSPVPSDCRSSQDALDRAACQQATTRLDACKDYNCCYNSTNASLTSAWRTICGPQGQLNSLCHEYYAVLRIECLILALNVSSSARNAAIDACKAKAMSDYDLSFCHIEDCSAPWPHEQASTNTDCIVASDAPNDRDMSGTPPYEKYYYANMVDVQTCESQCCNLQPESFVPLH